MCVCDSILIEQDIAMPPLSLDLDQDCDKLNYSEKITKTTINVARNLI